MEAYVDMSDSYLMYKELGSLAEYDSVTPSRTPRPHVLVTHCPVLHVGVTRRKLDRELKQLT